MKTNALVRQAEKLLIDGKFARAKDLLIDAMVKEPDNPEIYYLMGDALCKLTRFEEAIVMLQKADRLFPHHPRIYHLLGWAIFMNGDIDAGRSFMEVALESDSDNEQIYADLAVLEMKSNNLKKAKSWVIKGKKVSPNDGVLGEVEAVVNEMIYLTKLAENKSN